ncbi:CAP domain-containing protein [Virgisporangium aliadipatigenens]|nr:CAP domain-containing protein [Virgisporangium aliadipatigenens]
MGYPDQEIGPVPYRPGTRRALGGTETGWRGLVDRLGPLGIAAIVSMLLFSFGVAAAGYSLLSSDNPSSSGAAPVASDGPTEVPPPTEEPLPSPEPQPSASVTASARPSVSGRFRTDRGQESAVVTLLNQERRRNRCDGVRHDGKLHTAAQKHSLDMAQTGNVSQTGSDGSSPSDRMRAERFNGQPLGESVVQGGRGARDVLNALLNRSSDRKFLLDCDAENVGVGLVISPDGTTYWTIDVAE